MAEVNSTTQQDSYPDIEEWDQLEAKTDLLRGIYAYGFEKPSPIQRKAILPMFKRRDVIAQAQSGTGKTGCFAISSVQIADATKKVPESRDASEMRPRGSQDAPR